MIVQIPIYQVYPTVVGNKEPHRSATIAIRIGNVTASALQAQACLLATVVFVSINVIAALVVLSLRRYLGVALRIILYVIQSTTHRIRLKLSIIAWI